MSATPIVNAAALAAHLEEQLAAVEEAALALRAALVAVRKLGGGGDATPPPAAAVEAPAGDTPPAGGKRRTGKREPAKMPKHLCAKCGQRTEWDPCHICGHPVTVVGSLVGPAPDLRPGAAEEED